MNDYKEICKNLRMAGRLVECEDGGFETYLLSCAKCDEIADAIEQLVRERDAIERDLAGFEYCPLCAHCHEHIIGTNTETNEEEDLGECGQDNGVFHQLCMNGKFSRCGQYKWRGA